MYASEAKAGEIWKTSSRKGRLTVLFLEDVDCSKDAFVKAEIITGKAKYMSLENRINQQVFGQGTAGDVIDIRTTLLTLIDRVEPTA